MNLKQEQEKKAINLKKENKDKDLPTKDLNLQTFMKKLVSEF